VPKVSATVRSEYCGAYRFGCCAWASRAYRGISRQIIRKAVGTLRMNGGNDGARTRDLRRDRSAVQKFRESLPPSYRGEQRGSFTELASVTNHLKTAGRLGADFRPQHKGSAWASASLLGPDNFQDGWAEHSLSHRPVGAVAGRSPRTIWQNTFETTQAHHFPPKPVWAEFWAESWRFI
jgi:hypothetical protein